MVSILCSIPSTIPTEIRNGSREDLCVAYINSRGIYASRSANSEDINNVIHNEANPLARCLHEKPLAVIPLHILTASFLDPSF